MSLLQPWLMELGLLAQAVEAHPDVIPAADNSLRGPASGLVHTRRVDPV